MNMFKKVAFGSIAESRNMSPEWYDFYAGRTLSPAES
jgi:hypothetical protein